MKWTTWTRKATGESYFFEFFSDILLRLHIIVITVVIFIITTKGKEKEMNKTLLRWEICHRTNDTVSMKHLKWLKKLKIPNNYEHLLLIILIAVIFIRIHLQFFLRRKSSITAINKKKINSWKHRRCKITQIFLGNYQWRLFPWHQCWRSLHWRCVVLFFFILWILHTCTENALWKCRQYLTRIYKSVKCDSSSKREVWCNDSVSYCFSKSK